MEEWQRQTGSANTDRFPGLAGSLPDPNKLSVLGSTILLAYALVPFVETPARGLNILLPGAVFVFPLGLTNFIRILVAALAAAGTDWLIRSHPRLGNQKTYQHWLIPAFTAWVIGAPLESLPVGLEWWAVFAFGGVLLIMVFVAEYVSVDLSDAFHAPAAIVLTAVSFGLYLILTIAARAAEFRIYLMLPTLVLTMGLVVLRTLYLRSGGAWKVSWAIGIACVIGQMAIGLHYLPILPLTYGLILLGPAYALTSLAGALEEGHSRRTVWIEPVLMLAAIWMIAWAFSG
jgi:hypothetical protein